SLALIDSDLPSIVLTLGSTNISEGDGAAATTATVTRSPVASYPLVIDLVCTNAKVLLPSTVVIQGGQVSASFPIRVVDNLVVDGDQLVQVRVFIRATGSTFDIAEGMGATLLVRDNDGPALTLAFPRDVVAENLNPAMSGTVTRNTGTNSSILV